MSGSVIQQPTERTDPGAPARRSADPCPAALPTFFLIGAAKAGTTTLDRYLRRHPQLFLPDVKEPNYYADDHGRGEAWYRSLFAAAKPGQRCGEASAHYSCGTAQVGLETIVARIARDAPRARLIYILRHPIDRAYSHFREQLYWAQKTGDWPRPVPPDRQHGRAFTGPPSFEQYLDRDPHCVLGSRYIDVIELYRRHFAADQLQVLLLDDLMRDPAGVLRGVFAHLGVDPSADVADGEGGPLVANAMRDRQARLARDRVLAPLRGLPLTRAIGGRLPRPCREAVYAVLSRMPRGRRVRGDIAPAPMRPETRRRLLETLREPTLRLADHLDRDLSGWLV